MLAYPPSLIINIRFSQSLKESNCLLETARIFWFYFVTPTLIKRTNSDKMRLMQCKHKVCTAYFSKGLRQSALLMMPVLGLALQLEEVE